MFELAFYYLVSLDSHHPQNYAAFPILIEENERNREKFNSLRTTGETTFNLGRYISNLNHYSRFRITSIFIILADKNGTDLPYQIKSDPVSISIRIPKVFDDLGTDLELHTFYAEDDNHCSSSYMRSSNDEKKIEVLDCV